MVNIDKLKHCPFCGSNKVATALLPNRNNKEDLAYAVVCQNCGAMTWGSMYRPEAVKQWNRRYLCAEHRPEGAIKPKHVIKFLGEWTTGRYECPTCGKQIQEQDNYCSNCGQALEKEDKP